MILLFHIALTRSVHNSRVRLTGKQNRPLERGLRWLILLRREEGRARDPCRPLGEPQVVAPSRPPTLCLCLDGRDLGCTVSGVYSLSAVALELNKPTASLYAAPPKCPIPIW